MIKNKTNVFIIVGILVILFAGFASAEVCCEKTADGNYCDERGSESECNGDYEIANNVPSCDDATIDGCSKEGICMDVGNYICQDETFKVACDDSGYMDWDDSVTSCEDKPNWQYGCCIQNGKANYERKIECMNDIPNFKASENFQEADSHEECNDIERASDIGACVDTRSGSCDYPKTREECSNEFFKGMDCTNESLREYGVSCQDNGEKSCCTDNLVGCDLEQFSKKDVYKIDSCGNIMKELPSDGDCIEGEETCGIENGEHQCISLNCEGEDMKNGESECYYDGDGVSPGAEHWKKTCIQGEVDFEQCGEGRSKICVQETTTDKGEEINKAYCVPNYPEQCLALTSNHNKKLNNDVKELFENNDADSLTSKAPNDKLWKKVKENRKELEKKCNKNHYCDFYQKYSGNYKDDRTKYGTAFYDIGMCLPKYPKAKTSCDTVKFIAPLVFYDPGADTTHRLQAVVNWGIFDDGDDDEDKENRADDIRGFFDKTNELYTKIGDCGQSENYKETQGRKVLSYSPKTGFNPESGFKSKTRKVYRRIIYPHDKGDGDWYCGDDVEDCEVRMKKRVPGILNNIFPKSKSESEKIELNTPSGFAKMKAENPEKNKETLLTELMDKEYENKYNDFALKEDYIERKDSTYGLGKWEFIREWQKTKTLSADDFLLRPYSGIKINKKDKRAYPFDAENINSGWKPSLGGENCDECNPDDPNEQPHCTEYKCKSLGAACEFIDTNTDKEMCVEDEGDGESPKIEEITYIGECCNINKKDNTKEWNIAKKKEGDYCFEEGEKIEINISLDEYGLCRYEYGPSFDLRFKEMGSGGEIFSKSPNFEIEIPSIKERDVWEKNGKNYSNISFRCSDFRENAHIKQRIINYCVKTEPDKQAPQLKGFSPENGKSYPYNPGKVGIEMYIEDKNLDTCKYSYGQWLNENQFLDSENVMTCSTKNNGHTCSIDERIKQGEAKTYFACNDSEGNLNLDMGSYTYSVENEDITKDDWQKESGIEISSVEFEIEGNSYGSGDKIISTSAFSEFVLKAETSKGLDNGKANCSKSSIETSKEELPSFATEEFKDTNSNSHRQNLVLPTENNEGKNPYFIKIECNDDASSDTKIANFTLKIDTQSPSIVENYTNEKEQKLVVTTNENATCSYNQTNSDFNIDDGEDFEETGYTINHTLTSYNPDAAYYIRCEDELGNEGHAGTIGGGNAEGPEVTGSYYSSDNLMVTTDREAKCYYGLNHCPTEEEIGEETIMSSGLTKEHSVEWNSGITYHIKCEDQFGNMKSECKKIKPISMLSLQ